MSTKLQEPIEILFTGDLCPRLRVEQACLEDRPDEIYDPEIHSILQRKDLSVTNLECPLTNQENPIFKSGPALRSSKKSIAALTHGYFDVAALANNHIMDHGPIGLSDTLDACSQADIATVGAGANLEAASQVLYQQVKGQTIAIINVAEHEFCIARSDRDGANPLDPVQNYYQIVEATRKADYVIMVIHGGNEHYPLPNPGMVDMYRYFADIGVSAIIGHHSHFAGGYEIYNDVPIFYSLGNFLFDSDRAKPAHWYEGYMVRLTLSKERPIGIDLFPYLQYQNKPGIELFNAEKKDDYLKRIAEYSTIIKDSALLATHWEKFLDEKKNMYYSQLFGLNRAERFLLKQNWYRDFVINRTKVPIVLNLIRCQAHRQAVAGVLEKEYTII